MLKMNFANASIASASHTQYTRCLRNGAFNTGAFLVNVFEFLSLLTLTSGLECAELWFWNESDLSSPFSRSAPFAYRAITTKGGRKLVNLHN
jgi:hypothetical protein